MHVSGAWMFIRLTSERLFLPIRHRVTIKRVEGAKPAADGRLFTVR